VRFSTDAEQVWVNITRIESTASGGFTQQDDIMAFNGRFGVDVYAMDPKTHKWRWMDTSGGGSQKLQETLSISGMGSIERTGDASTGLRHFMLYLPTHVSLQAVAVGVRGMDTLLPLRPYGEETMERRKEGRKETRDGVGRLAVADAPSTAAAATAATSAVSGVLAPTAANKKPVMVWGSSIAQGGVVQNAGMVWPSVLQRLLDYPLLNFGFSGSCHMQPAVASLLTELSPSLFIIDCLPNMQAKDVAAATQPVLRQLRAGFGDSVPIVVLEGHTYSNAWISPGVNHGQQAKRAAQRSAVDALVKAGMKNLHYVTGDGKLASLGEAQYEATGGIGVHPSNIAHMRIAEYVAKEVAPLLK
jgi:hypothetical protein